MKTVTAFIGLSAVAKLTMLSLFSIPGYIHHHKIICKFRNNETNKNKPRQ